MMQYLMSRSVWCQDHDVEVRNEATMIPQGSWQLHTSIFGMNCNMLDDVVQYIVVALALPVHAQRRCANRRGWE